MPQRFVQYTTATGGPTSCVDRLTGHVWPAEPCPPQIYQSGRQKRRSKVLNSRNFIGEGIVEGVKANPIPVVAIGVVGLFAIPFIAKKLKADNWFGKYSKPVFMIGGLAVGLAIGTAIVAGMNAGADTVTEVADVEVDPALVTG